MMSAANSKTLASLLLLGLVGCASVRPSPRRTQVVRATVTLSPPTPKLREPPPADDEGCVAATEAHAFKQDLVRYYAQMRQHTLHQNGWTEPDSTRVKITAIQEPRWASPIGAAIKLNPEFNIVEGETHWTFLGDTSSSCGSPSTGWLHRDSKGTYFSMIPNRVCGRTEIIKVCGSMAGGGCGRQSRTRGHSWHVNLAEGEGVYGGQRIIMDVKIPVCYSIQPTGGFNRPP